MGTRSIFCLVVMLLAPCTMGVTLASDLPDSSPSSSEKVSGEWFFDGSSEKDRNSGLVYGDYSNPLKDKRGGFMEIICNKNDDDRGNLNFSVRFPDGTWKKDGRVKTVSVSSGSKKLKLRGSYYNEVARYIDSAGWWAHGIVVRRTDRPAFYDLFNASDTLTLEVNGRKVQFDLHGSQEPLSQFQRECPAVLPPCCLQESQPSYEDDEDAENAAQENLKGRWHVDAGNVDLMGLRMIYRFDDKSIHISDGPLNIVCADGHLGLILESRDDGWTEDDDVVIKMSSGKKQYSMDASLDNYSSEGMGNGSWSAFGRITDPSAFYALFNSTGLLTMNMNGKDKMQFDLRGAEESIKQLKAACPVGAK